MFSRSNHKLNAVGSHGDRHRETGQVVILLGLLLPTLLAFVAMGVDLGQGYLQRRTNQNGADAASVAGEQAMLKGATDSNVEGAITHVLTAAGYKSASFVFLTASSPTAGTDTTKVYVDAEYGSYASGSAKCTALSSSQYVGSLGAGATPPSAATCVHVGITTSDKTLFARIPLLGVAEVSASAWGSAGQIAFARGAGSAAAANATPTPTPAPWDGGSGEGFAIWGGNRADSTMLSVGSTVLFFADSGWNSGNDVQTSCGGSCQYDATQNFKGLADPQCFTQPLPSSCTGPNGAHGNEASRLSVGTEVQLVVVSSVTHQGSSNIFTPIGLASVSVLASCPSTPAYLQTGTNGVCGVIQNVDAGTLNSGGVVATPTPTPIVGNSN